MSIPASGCFVRRSWCRLPPPLGVEAAMGHSDYRTTLRYARVDPSALSSIRRALDG